VGQVSLAQSYQPFGETLSSSGEGATSYGFTGEWTDSSGLVNLRGRYYSPAQGRFLSRDAWKGDDEMPMSYNSWLYGYANPSRFVDPSGKYNRDLATDYAKSHDLDAKLDIFDAVEKNLGSNCANFVSSALSEGKITDPRPDPRKPEKLKWYLKYQEFLQSQGLWKIDPYDGKLKIPYWNKEIMRSDSPFSDYPNLYLYEWIRTDELLKFLVHFGFAYELDEYTGIIPHFRHDIDDGNRNNQAWLDYLKRNRNNIQPGDLVFYDMAHVYSGSKWDHVAMVVDKWESQTYVGADGRDPWSIAAYYSSRGWQHDMLDCDPPFDHREIKPRVVEKSGLLDYYFSRSIDNTFYQVEHINIVHMR
jgi:RHS repeat-associated protein